MSLLLLRYSMRVPTSRSCLFALGANGLVDQLGEFAREFLSVLGDPSVVENFAMKKIAENPALSWRASTSIPDPPATLGRAAGRDLWTRVQLEFDITDAAGATLLEAACIALDRAHECAGRVDADGLMIGSRAHPLIQAQLSALALVSRLLLKLGVATEPVKPTIGRPPKEGFDWKGF